MDKGGSTSADILLTRGEWAIFCGRLLWTVPYFIQGREIWENFGEDEQRSINCVRCLSSI